MSRAFVNEDAIQEDLPDRPISEHPNHVTERGLALIESQLDGARRAYGEAQAGGDRHALAVAARELRYWSSRRASADVIKHSPSAQSVQFGSLVTIVRDDGRTQVFQIVGEDEADAPNGKVSYMSPLARALMGKSAGDSVWAGTGDAEIVEIA